MMDGTHIALNPRNATASVNGNCTVAGLIFIQSKVVSCPWQSLLQVRSQARAESEHAAPSGSGA